MVVEVPGPEKRDGTIDPPREIYTLEQAVEIGTELGMQMMEKKVLQEKVAELEREKKARIYYQDLVYKTCLALDCKLGGTTVCGTLETPDRDFEERLEKSIQVRTCDWKQIKHHIDFDTECGHRVMIHPEGGPYTEDMQY